MVLVQKMIVWDIANLDTSGSVFTGSVKLYNLKPGPKVNTDNFKFDTILFISVYYL